MKYFCYALTIFLFSLSNVYANKVVWSGSVNTDGSPTNSGSLHVEIGELVNEE